jgi:hypothetical protein
MRRDRPYARRQVEALDEGQESESLDTAWGLNWKKPQHDAL